jgi:hypothetical protein
MRKQANRMTAIGQQLSTPLHAIHDELASLRKQVNTSEKTAEARASEHHKDSLEATRNATEWSRWLTIINLVLTCLMVWVLYSQLLTTRVDQRAWIKIEARAKPISENQPLEAVFRITNTGKTPAMKISQRYAVQKIPADGSPNIVAGPAVTEFVGMLTPNAPHEITVARQKDIPNLSEPLLLTKTDIQDFKSGKAYLAVVARIDYVDIYNRPHWIKYCYADTHNLGEGLVLTGKCVEFNSVDTE